MPAQKPGAPPREVTVGVVGADEMVHKLIALARRNNNPGLRLVPAVYSQESDAQAQALKIADKVDALLFAGPLPYDVATSSGAITVPSTYVPTGGPALQGTLLRGVLTHQIDPLRVSIDSTSERDLEDTYVELDLDPKGVHVSDYHTSVTPQDYLDFHRRLYRDGKTSGAITTVPTVASALTKEDIPCLKMSPSAFTLRQALNTAVLIGSGAKLEESRIAIVIVQFPTSALPPRTSPGQYWYQELKLTLHRELLQSARKMDAVVLPHDERSFIVITTLGSLRLVTDDLASAPFLGRASAALNIDLEVGIGLGRSTLEAEGNAYRAVGKATSDDTRSAYLIGPHDMVLRLPAAPEDGVPEAPSAVDEPNKDRATLQTLMERLAESGQDNSVIDAERVAQLMNVTLRTARRTLQNLVQAGLAWPMPPPRSKKVGRPPMLYQLLNERLDP